MTKELGKITKASIGYGGYQDVQFGLSLDFGGDAWGCSYFTTDMEEVAKTLSDAKKQTVEQLKGVPVEVTFDGMVRKDWRILKEVL